MPGEGETIAETEKYPPEGAFHKGSWILTPEQRAKLRPELQEDLKKSQRIGREAMERNAERDKQQKKK